jgi:hypothetical protein
VRALIHDVLPDLWWLAGILVEQRNHKQRIGKLEEITDEKKDS